MNANAALSPSELSIPDEVESSTGKLVYTYLALAGGASMAELERHLGLGGLTIAGVLDALDEKAVVERREDRYAAVR